MEPMNGFGPRTRTSRIMAGEFNPVSSWPMVAYGQPPVPGAGMVPTMGMGPYAGFLNGGLDLGTEEASVGPVRTPVGRRTRHPFTARQTARLESAFRQNQYPDVIGRLHLVRSLQISESRLQVWFQNRRAKARREAKEARIREGGVALASHAQRQYLRSLAFDGFQALALESLVDAETRFEKAEPAHTGTSNSDSSGNSDEDAGEDSQGNLHLGAEASNILPN